MNYDLFLSRSSHDKPKRLHYRYRIEPVAFMHSTPVTLVQQARADLPATVKTGLGDPETRELLMTRDVTRVVRLVRKGLEKQVGLQALPA